MLKTLVFRQNARAVARRPLCLNCSVQPKLRPVLLTTRTNPFSRSLHTTPILQSPEYDDATTSAPPGASGKHEGQLARTSGNVRFENPEDENLARSHVLGGRGGEHDLRTLASFSMEGKVSVVTGAARGLGLVMAQALVISGADLAIVDMNKEEADVQAKQLLNTFKSENPGVERLPKITTHFCDVASHTSVKEAFDSIVEAHGKVDNLVTAAGFTENYDAISYPPDRMQKLWGVNVNGTYFFATETARHLMGRKAPGSIVCIGSMSGSIVNVPQPQAPYNASKAAVRHLVSSLAVEWAHAKIRVNCISPGYMLTALTRKILDINPELEKQWTSLIPVGKMGRPEDLMGPVVFLSSDASGYMTGADLRVDGAYTCT